MAMLGIAMIEVGLGLGLELLPLGLGLEVGLKARYGSARYRYGQGLK